MKSRIINKYNLSDLLYYYNRTQNKIIQFEVSSITFDAEKDDDIKYNYFYPEDECYTSLKECYEASCNILEEHCEELKMELASSSGYVNMEIEY